MRALCIVTVACVLAVACSSFEDADATPPAGDDGGPGGGDSSTNDGGGGTEGGDGEATSDAGRQLRILAAGQKPLSVFANATNVVWGDGDGFVRFTLLDGTGMPSSITTGGNPNHVRYEGLDILWSDSGTDPTQGLFRDASGMPNRFYTGKVANFASYGSDYLVFDVNETLVRLINASGVEQKTWGNFLSVYDMIEDGGDVLFSHSAGISRLAAGGNQPTLLQGESDARGIAVDANAIYWIKGSDKIVRRDRTSGAVSDYVIEPGIHAIAADASGVYWQTAQALRRKSSAGLETLSDGFTSEAFDLSRGRYRKTALTAAYVVWATDTDIRRVEK